MRRMLIGLAVVTVSTAIYIAVQNRPRGDDDQPPPAGEFTIATFAGGCFWCMEPPFDELDGVLSTTSGYTGGDLDNPTYKQVSSGGTGHAEAVEIRFDPEQASYEELLEIFWRNIDPLARNRQFCDFGSQYRSGIFYHDDDQLSAALASKERIEQSGRFDQSIETEITAASSFYPAEEYHQDYYVKNPVRYKLYRYGCRRDRRLKELWGDPDD